MVKTRKGTETASEEHSNLQITSKGMENTTTIAILIQGKPVRISCGSCYFFSISKLSGVFKVEEINKNASPLLLKGRYYALPQNYIKDTGKTYGQDELMEYEYVLILSSQQFREGYRSSYKTFTQKGTRTFTMSSMEKLNNGVVRLKNPTYSIDHNISASSEMISRIEDIYSEEINRHVKDMHQQSSIVILTYDDYCMFRKVLKALDTGVSIHTSEAIKYHVITRRTIKIFFSRDHFRSKEIENAEIFGIERRRTNKRRMMSWEEEMDTIDDKIYKKFRTINNNAQYRQIM